MMTPPDSPDQNPSSAGLVRKTGVAVAGSIVTAAGVVMLVTPGPGIIAIAIGLSILGTEFKRPQQLLHRVKKRISGTDSKKSREMREEP